MTDGHKKFVKLAQNRTRKAIKDIRLVGNLSDRAAYDYSPSDVKQVLSAIESELGLVKQRFRDAQTDDSAAEFSLG